MHRADGIGRVADNLSGDNQRLFAGQIPRGQLVNGGGRHGYQL